MRCVPRADCSATATALEQVHRPESDGDWRRARDALRFQEAFVLQLALLEQRPRAARSRRPPRIPGPISQAFDGALPFAAHRRPARGGRARSRRTCASGIPMNRLLQGEVGSGKTLVALRAMLAVAESGGQSALLAPTEVLAGQHLRSIVRDARPRPRRPAAADAAHRPAADRRAAQGAARRGIRAERRSSSARTRCSATT